MNRFHFFTINTIQGQSKWTPGSVMVEYTRRGVAKVDFNSHEGEVG